MTEDRARPLVAFVLVSLLCAFILSLNMTSEERAATATEHAAQAVPAASAVIFGDTLKPRPLGQSAMGGLGSLTLNDAAAGVIAVPAAQTRRPLREATSRQATPRHRQRKVTPPRKPVRHHAVTPTPTPTPAVPIVSKHDNGRHLGWAHARQDKPGSQGNRGNRGGQGSRGSHGHGR